MRESIELSDLNFAPQAMPLGPGLAVYLGTQGDPDAMDIISGYLREKSHRFSMSFEKKKNGLWNMTATLTHDLACTQRGDYMGGATDMDQDLVAAIVYDTCKGHETIASFHHGESELDPVLVRNFSDVKRHLEKMKEDSIAADLLHTHYLMPFQENADDHIKSALRRPELLHRQKLDIFSDDFTKWCEEQEDALQFFAILNKADNGYYISSATPDSFRIYKEAMPNFGFTMRALRMLDEAMILPALESSPEGHRALALQKKDILNYRAWQHDSVVMPVFSKWLPSLS